MQQYNIMDLTQLILNNPDKYWDWETLSSNNEFDAIKVLEKFPNKNWDLSKIMCRKDFDISIVDKFPNMSWNLSEYVKLKLTIEEFVKYKSIQWKTLRFVNRNDMMEFVDARPDFDWEWELLSYNENITKEFIEKYQNKDWNWNILSYNKYIDYDFINMLPDKNWNWKYLSNINHINDKKKILKLKRDNLFRWYD